MLRIIVLCFMTEMAFNIALYRPVTTSALTYGTHLSRAVDGYHNNAVFANNRCVRTAPSVAGWISVNLQSVYTVEVVVLYGCSSGCSYEHTSGWSVYVGNVGGVAAATNDTLCRANIAATDSQGLPVICSSELSGSFVTIASASEMVLCEVQVSGNAFA